MSCHTQYCAAIDCSKSRGKNPELSFYKFPKDEERCRRWIINTRRADLDTKNLKQVQQMTLCEDHFTRESFMNPDDKGRYVPRKNLRHDAVPTVFSNTNAPKVIQPRRALDRTSPLCKDDKRKEKSPQRPQQMSQSPSAELLLRRKLSADRTALCRSKTKIIQLSNQPDSSPVENSCSEVTPNTWLKQKRSRKYCAAYGCSNITDGRSKKAGITFHAVRRKTRSQPNCHPALNHLPIHIAKDTVHTTPRMVKSCCAINCQNRLGARDQSGKMVTFHVFPFSQPERAKKWERAMHRRDFKATKWSLVCSEHFLPECFNRSGYGVRLNRDAIPTIFNLPARSPKTQKPPKCHLPETNVTYSGTILLVADSSISSSQVNLGQITEIKEEPETDSASSSDQMNLDQLAEIKEEPDQEYTSSSSNQIILDQLAEIKEEPDQEHTSSSSSSNQIILEQLAEIKEEPDQEHASSSSSNQIILEQLAEIKQELCQVKNLLHAVLLNQVNFATVRNGHLPETVCIPSSNLEEFTALGGEAAL